MIKPIAIEVQHQRQLSDDYFIDRIRQAIKYQAVGVLVKELVVTSSPYCLFNNFAITTRVELTLVKHRYLNKLSPKNLDSVVERLLKQMINNDVELSRLVYYGHVNN